MFQGVDMSRTIRRGLLIFALAAVAGLLWTARAQSLTTYNVTLSHAETSTDANGRLVLTALVAGDLPGTLTLAMNVDANGAVTGGEWAITVSYTEVTHLETPAEDGEDHAESLVQKGMLKGDVAGGTLTLSPDGSLSSLNGIVLSITGGTLAYEGASTSGNGLIVGTSLSDRDASAGTGSIIF